MDVAGRDCVSPPITVSEKKKKTYVKETHTCPRAFVQIIWVRNIARRLDVRQFDLLSLVYIHIYIHMFFV